VYCNVHMKSSTKTLQRKRKTGLATVLQSLKDYADEPAIKRVEEILTLLVNADKHLREQLECLYSDAKGKAEFLDEFKRMKESERAYFQTLELLNIKLSRYRWEATLSGDLDGFRSEIVLAQRAGNSEYSGRKHFDYTELRRYSEYTESFVTQRDQLLAEMGKPVRPEKAPATWEYMELHMVSYLLEALNKGEISRFRRCSECQKWFYAIRGHQHFCGDVCRRKHEAQNPAFKEKRRTYMRERYRPLQKELEKRSLTLAKAKSEKKGR